ncbi:MAG: DUF3293 domain-containing protein [Pseudomonadota bacterium]
MAHPPLTDDLLAAYKATDYIVEDDPPLILNIGEQNDGVRLLHLSFNVETSAFITAWNPGSNILPLDENYDRQADLLNDIEALRLNYFVGRGEHPDGQWSEDSYLLLGITQDQADALAIKYGQSAYVWIPMSGVPELRLAFNDPV